MKLLKVFLLFIFFFLASIVFIKSSYASTVIAPTSITANTTWTSDNVYVVQTSTTVQPGVQLTIQPGTIVKLQSSAYILIKGTLQASGTTDNKVVFTSYKDDTYGGDTNGDGTATTPAKGDWQYLEAYTGGTINCSYSIIRYGGKYSSSMIYGYAGALNIDHCIVEKSNGNGIEIKGLASITNNDITDFYDKGVYVNLASGSPTVSSNTITGGKYSIYIVNGSPNINSNILNNNSIKALYVINGSSTLSGNTLNGGNLTDNYGIVIEKGTINIQNNTITNFPNHEAVCLGSTGSNISGGVVGNTMSSCKYPLGFSGDKIPSITFDANNISECSFLGINLNVALISQTIPIYNLPYIVYQFNVNTGATVQIDPGTVFKIPASRGPSIAGTLNAKGTKQSSIIFTSLKDDSYGGDTNKDGNSSSPQAGDWNFISMAEMSSGTFDYVVFSYGSKAIHAVASNQLSVTNCDISRMSYHGIYISGQNTVLIESNAIHDNGNAYGYGICATSSSSPVIKTNDIYNNVRGIDISSSSSAQITGNYIHNNSFGLFIMMTSTEQNNCRIEYNNIENNTNYGLYNWLPNDPPVAVVTNNWWGDISGPDPIGSGDKINSTTKIEVTPWLHELYLPPVSGDGARIFCQHYDPATRNWSLVLEPIDSGTGAHLIDKSLIQLNGARSIDFNLSYNSLLLNEGPMGKGWGHNFETHLEAQTNGEIKLCWTANRENTFVSSDQVNYSSEDQACRLDSLRKNTDGTYILTRKDQSKFFFDTSGRLSSEQNSTGQVLQMTYSTSDTLTAITEPFSNQSVYLNYNSSGLLDKVSDRLNRQWQFNYDAGHNLTAISYPDTRSITFTYDTKGQVLSETDPEGNLVFSNTYDDRDRVIAQDDGVSGNQVSTITYDEATQPGNLITTITDRNGNTKKYIHGAYYQLIKVIDELGNETNMSYDADGNQTSITDAADHTTNMTYDDRGNLLTTTDADNNTVSLTYDDRNNLLSVQNSMGKTITYIYDTNNRVTSIIDQASNTTTFSYDTNGFLLSKTSPRGGVTAYTYQSGLLETETDPTNKQTTYTYDIVGRLVNTTNPAGKNSTINYDLRDHVTSTVDPLGHTVSFTYDGNGNILIRTDAEGNTTNYTYDGNCKLSTITDALGNVTYFYYDGEDRLKEITDPRGNVSTVAYDAKGRKISTTDALGHTVRTEYDAVDNVKGQYDAFNRQVSSITYDNLNRPITVTDALGNVTSTTYDTLGRITQTSNPLNQTTDYTYDDLNRLVQTVDALNGYATQEFDTDGNRTALVDPNNNRQEFAFDLAGRLTESNSLTSNLQYTYNQLGLLDSLTNGRDQTRSMQYDDAGRLVSQTDPDGTINYTYDDNGNPLTVTDASGTITRQYDDLNRVISYTDTRGNTIGYTYDAAGNLTVLTYPDNKQVIYTYDAANRLTQVQDWAGRITTYTYDANNRLVETQRPDGSVETCTYDNSGHLIQQVDRDQNNNILIQYDFTYNAVGNIITENSNQPEVILPDQNVTMTYTSDNRLATYNGQNLDYDADGNMTTGPLNGQITSYAFDSRNRLTAVGNMIYTYDAENNRIAIIENGEQKNYVINPNASMSQVLMQTESTGDTIYYIYGLGLIGEESNNGYKAYHYDYRGSTVVLTDIIGTITDQYRYGPYGELANQTGTTNTPFHYNGRDGVMTDDNGLYYMRARYYNPEVKRFINMDVLIGSINEGQSTNRFIYVYGNPVMVVDPLGLSGLWGSNGLWGDRSLSQNLKDTAHYLKSDEAKEAYKNTAIVAGATYGTLTGITFAPEIAAGASTTASIAAPKVAEIASKASSKIVSIAQNGEKYAQIAYQKVDLWIWAHTREILTTQKYIMDLNPKAGTPPETMLGALIGFIQANVPEAYEPQSPKPLPGTHLSSSPANTRCR